MVLCHDRSGVRGPWSPAWVDVGALVDVRDHLWWGVLVHAGILGTVAYVDSEGEAVKKFLKRLFPVVVTFLGAGSIYGLLHNAAVLNNGFWTAASIFLALWLATMIVVSWMIGFGDD